MGVTGEDIERVVALETQLSQYKYVCAALLRDIYAFENMTFFERLEFLLNRNIVCTKQPIDEFYCKGGDL